ncbi:MAG: Na-K-Cl cotransporter [Candidatus Dadabacteria bacterium]|nr:MAG: Na-K-Cl cotransporter [Candidatus Dadabacteria bacterium]
MSDTIAAKTPVDATRLGTFSGVYVPTLLTVMGAIFFLREGWVVGNAGIGGALLIIALAGSITLATALSIATMASNIRLQAVGTFALISQSVGVEIGGAVALPLFFAQAAATVMYIFAFLEGLSWLFPDIPAPAVLAATFTAIVVIAWASTAIVARTQYIVLAVFVAAIISIAAGINEIPASQRQLQVPFWGTFPDGSFWYVFAVFFPAVTGILTGVNMSGSLKNPRRSIARGTIAALLTALAIYIAGVFWLAVVADEATLRDNLLVMVDRSAFAPLVVAGILGTNFSSALSSLVTGARILESLGRYAIVPGAEKFGHLSPSGEPRRATLGTAAVAALLALFGLFSGGLDAIAPLLTMFFLIAYGMLNAVVVIEQSFGLVSFRPRFRIPRFVPIYGAVGCLFAMVLISPVFGVLALLCAGAVYAFLQNRKLNVPWSDVRSGLLVTIAEWIARKLTTTRAASERSWKPNVLVPVRSTDELIRSYRFLVALTSPAGGISVLLVYPADLPKNEQVRMRGIIRDFQSDRVFSRYTVIASDNYARDIGIALNVLQGAFFRPNTVFYRLQRGKDREPVLDQLLQHAVEAEMGLALLAEEPQTELGREQAINVWITPQGPEWQVGLRLKNSDLSLLLSYQLSQNWGARITLITVVQDPDERLRAQQFLEELIELGRLPHGTRAIAIEGDFRTTVERAPQADLNVFGLQQVDLDQMWALVSATRSSCLFVRDSGQESALA